MGDVQPREQDFDGVWLEHTHGKDVALVGNGPSVLEHENGGVIDAHDTVVRFNAGVPRAGQGACLGRRTDLLCAGNIRVLEVALRNLEHRPQIIFSKPRRCSALRVGRMGDNEWPTVRAEHPSAVRVPLERYLDLGLPRPSAGVVFASVAAKSGARSVTLYGYDCWEGGDSWWKERDHEAVITMQVFPHSGRLEAEALRGLGYVQEGPRWTLTTGGERWASTMI